MTIEKPSGASLTSRILLAEDEPTSRAILAAYLGDAGYEVEEAEDGAQAWNILSADKNFALVVTDRNMPQMDGLTLALKMKQDAQLREIPVIMQTSATSQTDILQGIKAGVFYYLAKPYEEATLHAIVRSAINDRKKSVSLEHRIVSQKQALGTLAHGEFWIKTPDEAENTASLLSSVFARPDLAAAGLYELMLNAIEHGNLGLGGQLKNELLSSGKWDEEIDRRLQLPENANKKVVIQFTRSNGTVAVVIRDEGAGFDWRPFMQIEPSRATQGSGRGIAKANLLSFDSLEYQGSGNQVMVRTTVK